VRLGLKVQSIAYLLLQEFDKAVVELYDSAAAGTDKMVVMFMTDDVLIYLPRLAQFHRPDETAFDEKVQGPINGRTGDLLALLMEKFDHFIGIEMPVSVEDRLKDCLSFRSKPQIPSGEKLLENQ
jgi:hypothetical protein